jgi:SAM-dependent methyltransferase
MSGSPAATHSVVDAEGRVHASSPFGAPRGALGWIAGRMMARMNAAMNRACIDVLAPQPGERVLEVGFGHGETLAAIAERIGDGLVAGADPSSTMVRMARRRNRRALGEGRVRLDRASVVALPYAASAFDAVLSVNAIQHWGDREAGLAEVRRVLAPGGRLVLGLRLAAATPGRFTPPGFPEEAIDAIAAAVAAAGFVGEARTRRDVGREIVVLSAVVPSAGSGNMP